MLSASKRVGELFRPRHLASIVGGGLLLFFLLGQFGSGDAQIPAQDPGVAVRISIETRRVAGSATTSITYSTTTADLANPERGFYHHTETFASSHTPLDVATMQDYRQNEHVTLVLHMVYLDSFVHSPISANFLDAIQADFGAARQAGVKLVLRFAYNQNDTSPNPDDPALSQLLEHLDQLEPILQSNADLVPDYAYLSAETRYLPMGGETCFPNPPRSAWITASQELALFYWSYLNRDWHPQVLDSWGEHLTDTVKLKLGYRLALQQGTYSHSHPVQPGGDLVITLTVKNEGWAAPFNPRPVELILHSTLSGAEHAFPLSADPRFWAAGDAIYTASQVISLPLDLPTGDYELLLNLPDPAPTLRSRPEYSIRLANSGLWEADTGYNTLLHTITVSGFVTYLPVVVRSQARPPDGNGDGSADLRHRRL